MECYERLFLGMTLSVAGRQRPVPSLGRLSYRKKEQEAKSGPINLLEIFSESSLSASVLGLGSHRRIYRARFKKSIFAGCVKNI